MSSTDLKKLARRIQQESGSNYTTALREAKHQRDMGSSRVAAEDISFQTQLDAFPYDPDHLDPNLHFGVTKAGQYINLNFTAKPHLLCAGTTGSGKTTFLKNLVFSALRQEAFYEVSVISTKLPSDYTFAEPFARGLASNLEDALALVRAVHAECVARNEVRELLGAPSFPLLDFFALTVDLEAEGVTHARHLLFIEELLMLIEPETVPDESNVALAEEREQVLKENQWRAEIRDMLTEISRHGSATGIHIVAPAQRLGFVHKLLPALMDDSTKVFMGRPSKEEMKLCEIAPSALPSREALAPKGRGIIQSASGTVVPFQIWWMDDDTRSRLLDETLDAFLSKQERFNLKRYRD
ncbi:FtsK/SpoIIIE domain-containing protein [Glutamicibacter ardleyensis]|uniref:FtsK/SpoIIIE domain-containing protein n=1 Tax=Glutamicibacter ardleyensis TaxID=225894 RepID=UPI003FD21BC8